MDYHSARMQIRQSGRWRAAVLGLRVGVVSMPILLLLMLLGRFTDAKEVLVPIIFAILSVAIISILAGWAGAVLLIRETSRYAGANTGSVNPSRAWELMQALVSDLCNFRKWQKVPSSVRLRKYRNIGAVLAAVGAIGFAVSRGFVWGDQISPLCMAMVVGGLLSMLYSPWVRLRARRRSSRYAVEGAYDITDDNIMMRSGSESGGIAWDGVAQGRGHP